MPIILSLVGRPNVGKSTLFNCLTRTREALVADISGLTRDRQYGVGRLGVEDGDTPYVVIDSGGLTDWQKSEHQPIESLIAGQVWQAVEESHAVLFVVDARAGLQSADEQIAQKLHKSGKQVFLVLNKSEGLDESTANLDFYALGFGKPYAIAASHNARIELLMEVVLSEIEAEDGFIDDDAIRVAIVGRPNVGKSTLINRLIGQERMLAFDMPGTTRDSIEVDFVDNDQNYKLIDTAGVRRRGKIKQTIEKFSVIKTIQAINCSNVVVVLVDATEGFTDQDANLLGMVIDSGKALIIGVNKWDGLDSYQRTQVKTRLERNLHFIDFAPLYFISALHGSNIRNLFGAVDKVYKEAMRHLPTNALSRALEQAVKKHPPPLSKGHRVKLRYAHQGGHNPPLIVIHGNKTNDISESYRRYLGNHFRNAFKLGGTPIRLSFKTSDNPYQGRKNTLSKRQIAKKLRLKKHNK